MQTRLFQPFSQADSATSRRFGGSGLGLSISKKLVEVMGGSIGFDSVLGVGSCFWVTLPLASSEHPETAEQPYDLSGKRTLIVDDNATNRNILTAYLSGWGLAVSQADNGSAALMQLQTSVSQGTDYDLILLDMQMPIMDGLTVAKCLAHIPMLANIPIVLLSSGDQFDLADFQGTAIVQRLLKPVRQSQLFDAIVTALQCHTAVTVKPIKPKVPLPRYDGKRILVVEDNKINQKVIVAQLAKFNVVPDLADNGQLALDKLADNGYDLILMDCQMPVMDGYIATRELRLLEARKGLPRQTVIALTANALDGEREKCLAVGMDDYLTKPIITECLMDVLAYRLGHQHAPVPVPQNHSAAENNRGIWDEAAALKQVEGDDALLYEMIELFLLEAPKQLNELSAYQTEGNLLELANTAHAIKGTLGHFCADTAKDYTAILEHAARSGQSAPFQDMTAAVITSVTDLTARLMLAKNPNNPNK
jgi:CheY-like chemotaxis protein